MSSKQKLQIYLKAKQDQLKAKRETDKAFKSLFKAKRYVYFRRQYNGPTYKGEIKQITTGGNRALLLRNIKTGTTCWIHESWLETAYCSNRAE